MIEWRASVAGRLAVVRAEIEAARRRSARAPGEVRIVAVTKGQPPEAVRAAADAGIVDFGENYVQELEAKRDRAADAAWHFLGRVQSNKAAAIARADLIHSLEPGRGMRRLAAIGVERGRPVRALVEVRVREGRPGVAPGDLDAFLDEVAALPGLAVEGLMTVPDPAPGHDPREAFATLRDLRERSPHHLPELSMGMSADYPVAVEEGATMVRIGTALFGPRPAA